MQLITDEYRKLNEELHISNKHYGVSGVYYLNDIAKLLQKMDTQDLLDYGREKTTLAQNLPFTIKKYDPTIQKYKHLPAPADLVVCTDVLEHIEPEMLDS